LDARFEAAAKMQAANGQKYGLPVVNLLHDHFDPHNAQHLKKLLKDYGLIFLSQYDISIIYAALTGLSSLEVNADKDLLILAALSYCEVGQYLDSDLFIRKARMKFDPTDQEKNMLEYVDLKNKLQLGQITMSTFRDSLEKLKGDSDRNNIILDINILRYSLAEDINAVGDQDYKDRLNNIFDRISKSNLPEGTQQLYNLWNATNESLIVSNTFSYAITLHRTSKAVGNELSNEAKGQHIKSYLSEENTFLSRISEIFQSAVTSKNEFVQATALQVSATHLVQKIIFYIGLDIDTNNIEDQIAKWAAEAIRSYNLFVQLQLTKDAHFSLSLAIELLDAAKALCNSDVDKDLEYLTGIMAAMEKELMLKPNTRTIAEFISEKKNKIETQKGRPPMSTLKDYSDPQLDLFARMALKSLTLPEERYVNVHGELNSYRLFYNRCRNPDIEPLQKVHDSTYRIPIIFILKNKKTGIISVDSHDMEHLLSSWGY
jgi:hypothetical protein